MAMMNDAAPKVNGYNRRSIAKISEGFTTQKHSTEVKENAFARDTIAYQNVIEELLKRPIAFQRIFVTITKSVKAALMLSQAWYWKDKGRDPNGWFYKTQEEWEKETGLSRYEQENARKTLRATKFWQEETRGIPAKLHYRLNKDALYEAMLEASSKSIVDLD